MKESQMNEMSNPMQSSQYQEESQKSDQFSFRINGKAASRTSGSSYWKEYQRRVSNTAKRAVSYNQKEVLDGLLKVRISEFWKGTKDSYNCRRIDGADPDNIAKTILDGMKGVCYKDDSQVVSLTVEKWYTEKNTRTYTEISITEL